jgi:hypothetical protein
MKLPTAPYDACDKVTTRVSSLSLVRYKNNDYSAPTRYGHQEVLAKGYVDRVEIVHRDETIAVHPSCTLPRFFGGAGYGSSDHDGAGPDKWPASPGFGTSTLALNPSPI